MTQCQHTVFTDEWEVYTPSGWQPFDGVLITEQRNVIQIEDSGLICTPDHRVLRNDEWVEAQYLDHKNIADVTTVYDLINVAGGHQYITGNEISHNCALLYWDEAALVPANIAEDFWASIFPTVSSGTETKVIISSTPFGYNLFWKLWTESLQNINGFVSHRVNWWEIPGRDDVWYQEQRRVLGPVRTAAEVDCSFEGSSHTLISAKTISSLPGVTPIKENEKIKIFKDVIPDHQYVAIVDTARGVENDYSVVMVIDITMIPYEVVLVYRDNTISSYAFPQIVSTLAASYNNAYCLIESNDAGGQVADTLFHDFEYDNMFYSKGESLSESGKITAGIRTTAKVKRLGATAIKTIIENNNIIINDRDIISEMSVFVAKKGSWAAESSAYHDDLMMCLVLFGWLTQQQIFKDITDTDTRAKLFSKQSEEIDNLLLPLGLISTGIEQDIPEGPFYGPDAWIFDSRLQIGAENG